MVETIHWNRQRKNYRRQIEHDRAVQAAVLRGEVPPEWSKHDERDEDDEMGDTFSITGDATHHHHYAESAQPGTQSESTTGTIKKASTLAIVALIAASLVGGSGIGAGVPWLLGAYGDSSSTTTNTNVTKSQNLGVEIEVIPGGSSQ
jgi:hypothetical protein